MSNTSWIEKDLSRAENKIGGMERDISDLEKKVRTLEKVADFFLTESKTAHVEKTKGGCTPACQKCKFYKELEEILYE